MFFLNKLVLKNPTNNAQINSLKKKIQKDLETIHKLIVKEIIECSEEKTDCTIRKLQEQNELSKLMVLLQRIERQIWKKNSSLERLKELNILIKSLYRAIKFSQRIIASSEEINQDYLRRIRWDIERVIYRYEYSVVGFCTNLFMHIYRSKSVKIKIISGLFVSTTFALLASTFFMVKAMNPHQNKNDSSNLALANSILDQTFRDKHSSIETGTTLTEGKSRQNNDYHDSTLRNIILVTASGTLGGVVSILSRLKQFDKFQVKKNRENLSPSDPATPIFLGAFKPIIASSFGLLIFALIESGIVQIDSITNKKKQEKAFLVCAIAFIVGFSERLAEDVIHKTEDVIGSRN